MSDVYVCIYYKLKHARLGGSGGCSPRKLDALRLLMGAFLDKSRAVVATISSNFWLSYTSIC